MTHNTIEAINRCLYQLDKEEGEPVAQVIRATLEVCKLKQYRDTTELVDAVKVELFDADDSFWDRWDDQLAMANERHQEQLDYSDSFSRIA